jgi:Uma2 family endonuclease
MSMPALHVRTWTLEEVERLIAERPGYTPRYELVDGELLVTPGPSGGHQRIAFVLSTILRDYAKRIGFGEIRQGPGDVRLTDDSYLEPDIFVIPTIDGRFPTAANRVNEVVLAVEVLSASSARHDRVTKRHFFQRNRVPEYWVVDPAAQVFEIWHPDDQRPQIVEATFEWKPSDSEEPLEVDVARFFASVADGARLSGESDEA